MPDPFASIAKPDPFASIAKPIAAGPNMQMTPADLGVTPGLPGSRPSALQKAAAIPSRPSTMRDVIAGAAKGFANTLFNSGVAGPTGSYASATNLAYPAIGVNNPASKVKAPYMNPSSTAQKVGYTGEQAAEWLIPSGAEEKAASLFSGKVAPLAAKIGTSALESGVRNMSQGGDFIPGALAGAGGAAVSPLLSKGANAIANVAMAPVKRVLKSLPEGVNIGQTAMKESTGLRPSTIAKQLGTKVTADDAALSGALQTAANRGVGIPLSPSRQLTTDEMLLAKAKNAPGYIQDVGKVDEQLRYQYDDKGRPTIPLPDVVDPVRARSLRQGVDLTIGSFNPDAQSAIAPLQERVRGSISGAIHAAVPESAPLDLRLSNLIPARDAAKNVSFNPNVTQAILNRVGRPTGALTGAIGGGLYGYHHGGTPEALTYGAAGLVAPELIASPEGQMFVARGLNSPTMRRVIIGGGLQFNRPSLNKQKPE